MAYNTFGTLFGGQFHMKGLRYEKERGFLVIMDLLGVKGIWRSSHYEEYFTKWENINYFIDNSFQKLPQQFHKY